MNTCIRSTTLALGLALVALQAHATRLYVNLNNLTPQAPYTNWATAATRIQDAVDQTKNSDEVVVSNGIYTLGGGAAPGLGVYNRVVITRRIKLFSLNGPDDTIILGQGPLGIGASRCVWMTNGAQLVGFTLSNGYTFVFGDGADRDRDGGGVYVAANGIVSNCLITSCRADRHGAGVLLDGGGMVADCTFVNNCSEWNAGGVSCQQGGAVHRSTFAGNIASNWGGGVVCEDDGTVDRCTFYGNDAYMGGAVYGNTGGRVLNSLIAHNTCRQDGGGVFLNGDVEMRNVTVCANSATRYGGGIVCRFGGTNYNCLIYYNTAGTADDNHHEQGTSEYYAYCCTLPSPPGTGNVNSDPQCVDVIAGDFALRIGSPCIDAGNNVFAPGTLDLDGRQRFIGNPQLVDIGCYERVPPGTDASANHYVAPDGGNTWPYTSPAAAARNIQDAIDAAGNGETVNVAFGTYTLAYRGVNGMKSRIAVDHNKIVVGASADPGRTIIQGQRDLITGGLGSNAVRCAYLTGDVMLVGLTLRGGATRNDPVSVPDDFYRNAGGGVIAIGGAALSNCVAADCLADNGGGFSALLGIHATDCLFVRNRALQFGGGGAISAGADMLRCYIDDNEANLNGGGVFAFAGGMIAIGEPTGPGPGVLMGLNNFTHCSISSNACGGQGAGIYATPGSVLDRCWIFDNGTTDEGGGIYFQGGGLARSCVIALNGAISGGGVYGSRGGTLENCTVVDNFAPWEGGGVYCHGECSNINSIIYRNTSVHTTADNYTNSGSDTVYLHCDTTPAVAGIGNITNDPAFRGIWPEDYYLSDNSPCIDAGTNLPYTFTGYDYAGEPRIHDGIVDIGAYEWVPEPGCALAAMMAIAAVMGRRSLLS